MKNLNISEMFNIKGKKALVTGATGGLGNILAKGLSEAGANVIITGRSKGKLLPIEQEIKEDGGVVYSAVGDPCNYEDVKRIVEEAKKAFGGIDILVTAAGMNKVAPIIEQPVKDWEAVIDANLKGTYYFCKEVGRVMIEQGKGGKVILVGSARGHLGMMNYSAYAPSKAAVHLLAKSLGCEWGKYNINVNAIAPTVFRTDLTQWMFDDKAVYKKFLERIPVGRLGEPEDFIGTVIFLASKASDFITGAIIDTDGGYAAG